MQQKIKPLCPKCGGEMFDKGKEFEKKFFSSGTPPRFSCKDSNCKWRYSHSFGWVESKYRTACWRVTELSNSDEFKKL